MAKEYRDRERQATRQLSSDPQSMFGGLPVHDDVKIPLIKKAPANRLKFKSSAHKEIKKFSLNEFLDKYLEDDKNANKPGNEENVEQKQLVDDLKD